MTKHFAHRKAAEEELEAFGFKPMQSKPGRWINEACIADIHPRAGSDVVAVSYRENTY
jgi:hypothetical protein